MIYNEVYQYFKKELLKAANNHNYFSMVNEPLAKINKIKTEIKDLDETLHKIELDAPDAERWREQIKGMVRFMTKYEILI